MYYHHKISGSADEIESLPWTGVLVTRVSQNFVIIG